MHKSRFSSSKIGSSSQKRCFCDGKNFKLTRSLPKNPFNFIFGYDLKCFKFTSKKIVNDAPEKKTKKNNLQNWAIGFVVWTIVGLSFAGRSLFHAYREGIQVNWKEIVSGFLIDFYIWGAVSPLIFRVARRFPVERGKIAGRIAFHFFAGVIFIFVVNLISIPAYWYLGFPSAKSYPTFKVLFDDVITSPYMIHQGAIVYWGTLIAAHAFEYYRKFQAGKTRAAELSTRLAQAQLAALKMQIHPHFLFNTLNSIASLLHKDVEAADRMIARLSDFLRMTLKNSGESKVSLEQELAFIKNYLEIEEIRFRDRLDIEMEIAPETLNAQVPNLILQPLIENAMRHGIAPQIAGGKLRIQTKLEEGRLLIKIEDNGPGLNGSKKTNSDDGGVGLTNTRARLEQFYQDDFVFEILNKENKRGAIVNLNVPYLT